MKFGTMFGDIFSSLFKKPATEKYPFVKKAAPERLHGRMEWDASKCIGCNMCVRDCPANALDLIVIDKSKKRFVMKYNTNRCIYCAQCVSSCRFGALKLSNETWELAALNQDPFTVYYSRYEDADALLAKEAARFAGEPNYD
jgi:formate hydrogenlyase subunit 6/NADH:ubiquinone oxidoreductase subunit I